MGGVKGWHEEGHLRRILGWEKGRQPDWFQDNISKLEELILKRNVLFVRWLKTNCQREGRYVTQRREVAREVRRSKNAWFPAKGE